jgi:hypothetical protein
MPITPMTPEQLSIFMKSQWSSYGDSSQVLKDPIPLNTLCSACFGSDPKPEFVAVCFDGCMQQKNDGRTVYNRTDEHRDKRLFVFPDASAMIDNNKQVNLYVFELC